MSTKRDRGMPRTADGVVTSDKMHKTIVVRSERLAPHPLYGKYVKRVTQYRAHDENNEARVGDLVRLVESRRTSRTKAWRLLRVLETAPKVE